MNRIINDDDDDDDDDDGNEGNEDGNLSHHTTSHS
ncbi:hypothetical protein QR98_0047920 [Sarcoptes scabiei]|uniref:Uncharacterized protein n=1 Tax=Sarcoptes scabiei TaxID=52283 RepID=A0A132A5S5_SARSC|nr:hypothetical protein QR98_0047920 [Sarcoptes scabiei]